MSAAEAPVDTPAQADPPASDGPGARLRAAREAAGLSLDQVAQQLKLAPRQVRALEDEDFAQLPGRTFARGFVRNYARLLNLDGDDLLALLPDPGKAPALEAPALQSTGTMIAELPAATVARSGVSPWLIPILLVTCIIVAAAYEWYRGALALPGDTARPAATAPESSAPSPTAPAVAAGTSSTPLPNPVAAPASPEPAATETSAGATTAAPAAAPESADPGASPAAAASAPLVLSYRSPSWTEVRDRSGQLLISRLVDAGSEQRIGGTPPFDIVIGNAPGVVLVYRGKPIDLTRYTRQNVARLRLP